MGNSSPARDAVQGLYRPIPEGDDNAQKVINVDHAGPEPSSVLAVAAGVASGPT